MSDHFRKDCPQIIQLEALFRFTNGWRKTGFVGRSSTPGSDRWYLTSTPRGDKFDAQTLWLKAMSIEMMLNYCIQYLLEETAALMWEIAAFWCAENPEGRYYKTKYRYIIPGRLKSFPCCQCSACRAPCPWFLAIQKLGRWALLDSWQKLGV